MNDLVLQSATFGVTLSLVTYMFGLWLKKKVNSPIVNPLLISSVLIILILVFCRIDYESYNSSAKYLSYLLTPTTVCLAIPLYQQLQLLRKHFVAIVAGILSGVLTSAGVILGMSVLFGFTHKEYVTLLPKSITTAIGMNVSEELGGYVAITVSVIAVTGILGNLIGDAVCRLFRIKHPISKGLALGTSAHVIGTTKAMEMGEVEGAVSGLALVVAGLFTVVGASVFAMWW